ncbi:MAG: hypothetical protein KatS3mg129_1994 [Leptospiraceae bacterium]|nr:MAG: hypothetical protein KatS3mg129_1994 [Leptospiraceae bacterium]
MYILGFLFLFIGLSLLLYTILLIINSRYDKNTSKNNQEEHIKIKVNDSQIIENSSKESQNLKQTTPINHPSIEKTF